MVEAISVIKYEGSNDVLVHKHEKEDFTIGSQLIVHETQEALFFRDGKVFDQFTAGRHTLVTNNIPKVRDYMKLGTGGVNVFHCEVYFINMITQMGIRWGTDSKVRLFDPASGLHVEIGASGNFNMKVTDARKLVLKLVGTTEGLIQSEAVGDGLSYGNSMFRALIINKVKANLARIIKEQSINILEIDAYLDVLSSALMNDINATLDEYGLNMPEFYVTTIQTPDDDPNYVRLKQQFADKTLKVREEEVRKAEAEAAQQRKIVEAQTEAQLKAVSAQGDAEAIRIKAQAEAEAYKMKAEAEAAEMQMKGYTYRDETARQVGLEAMQNGITGGNGGGASGGIGDVASLGVTLGAMGGVINMTRDAMAPIMGESQKVGEGFGNVISGENGQAAPAAPVAPVAPAAPAAPVAPAAPAAPVAPATPAAPVEGAWNCANCGKTGITSRFCPDCGTPRATPN
ncbi:MAG: SPFH domain-containing protein [Saccharofermentans sp.]|nr:SPFH domain-containing protein [Saccharofermentans sp.]